MITATEARAELEAGNARYVAGERQLDTSEARLQELAGGQAPFAIILGCADSRVPPELIFDQGLGNLFVIRVAGNIVDPHQLGSIEYAVIACGTPLLVVLGHSSCGAVSATIGALRTPQEGGSPNIGALVEKISPAVKPLFEQDLDDSELLSQAVRANVHAVIADLRANSALLDERIAGGDLEVLAAEYSLESGQVTFLA